MPSSEADEEDFDDKSDLEEEERSLAQYSRREEQILHEGQQSIFTGEQVNINRSSMFGDDEHQLNKDEEDEEEPVVEDVVTHKRVHYKDEEDDHEGAGPHRPGPTYDGPPNPSATACPTAEKTRAMQSPPPPAANRSRLLLLKATQAAGGRLLTPTESNLSGSNFSETHRAEKERRARISYRSVSNTEEEDAQADAEELGETSFRKEVDGGAIPEGEDQAASYKMNDQQIELCVEGGDLGMFRLEPYHQEPKEEGVDEGVSTSRITGRIPDDLYQKGKNAGDALCTRAIQLSDRYGVNLHTVFKIMQLAFDPPRTSSWNDFLQWFKQRRREDKAFAERNPCNGCKFPTSSVR